MADNEGKREIINRAVLKFGGGGTSAAEVLYEDLDDSYFTAPFTNVPDGRNDILAACVSYGNVLEKVLRDLKPDFARQFADLGAEIRINKEIGDWQYVFELPSDFLVFIRQLSQNDKSKEYDCRVKLFRQYAHVVKGSDDQAYYCSVAHTSASATKPITGADYATKWALYDEDGDLGAAHVSGWSYKASQTGRLLLTNEYSNDPSTTVDSSIDSAFIEYIPYVQGGINDEPAYYDEDFKNALATALWPEIAIAFGKDNESRLSALKEYKNIASQDFLENQEESKHIPDRVPIWQNSKNLILPS